MKIYDRRQENSFINFVGIPRDGDIIIDVDGKKWIYKNLLPFSSGIYLEDENKKIIPRHTECNRGGNLRVGLAGRRSHHANHNPDTDTATIRSGGISQIQTDRNGVE